MRKTLLSLIALLPLGAYAQSDTLYVKGGSKFAVTITKVEGGRVHYTSGNEQNTIAEANLIRYHWANKPAMPAKKDNVIYIETTDTPDEAFVKLGRIISDSGFPIALANKEIGIINTSPKAYTAGSSVLLNATIKPGPKTVIALSGIYDGADFTLYGVTSEQKITLDYRGMSNSPFMKAWLEMDKVAKAYGGTVTYGKR